MKCPAILVNRDIIPIIFCSLLISTETIISPTSNSARNTAQIINSTSKNASFLQQTEKLRYLDQINITLIYNCFVRIKKKS